MSRPRLVRTPKKTRKTRRRTNGEKNERNEKPNEKKKIPVRKERESHSAGIQRQHEALEQERQPPAICRNNVVLTASRRNFATRVLVGQTGRNDRLGLAHFDARKPPLPTSSRNGLPRRHARPRRARRSSEDATHAQGFFWLANSAHNASGEHEHRRGSITGDAQPKGMTSDREPPCQEVAAITGSPRKTERRQAARHGWNGRSSTAGDPM